MSIEIIIKFCKNTEISIYNFSEITDNIIREWSEMKKYLILITATILVISGIFTYGSIVTAATDVSIYTVKPTSAENTISANGKLQYESEKTVSADNYCFIVSVEVSAGDNVKKGDILMTVDELSISGSVIEKYPDADVLISTVTGEISDDIKSELKKYCTRRTIYSDSEGTVSAVMHHEEEFVARHSELIKLCSTDKYIIPVNINETMISRIKTGQNVDIRFSAIEGKKFKGKVIKLADEAKQVSGLGGKETSVEVLIKPEKIDEKLRIGYNAECDIVTSTDENIILVPYEYIRSDENGSYVFIAQGRQAYKKYITTGTEYHSGASVISGIKANENIITNANEIYDGQRIKVLTGE